MGLRWQCLDVDCTDPRETAAFWEAALGWRRTHETDHEVVLEPPAGSPEDGISPDLLFLRVPEGKAVKNRLHLDLRPDDQAVEVARLEGLGAARVDVGQSQSDSWVVMADPSGNEFCVLRAFTPEELERWAAEDAAAAADQRRGAMVSPIVTVSPRSTPSARLTASLTGTT